MHPGTDNSCFSQSPQYLFLNTGILTKFIGKRSNTSFLLHHHLSMHSCSNKRTGQNMNFHQIFYYQSRKEYQCCQQSSPWLTRVLEHSDYRHSCNALNDLRIGNLLIRALKTNLKEGRGMPGEKKKLHSPQNERGCRSDCRRKQKKHIKPRMKWEQDSDWNEVRVV